MNAHPLRVLIVDDSRIFRSVIEESLAGRSDIQVVGSVWSGQKAIEFAQATPPDFVTLDIEMPGMNGIETLKGLRELGAQRKIPLGVLLVSSHTSRGAAITIQGLEEGAFDFITKPHGPDPLANAALLREQLLEKIDAFKSRRFVRSDVNSNPVSQHPSPRRETRFRAIVIGSSTGGPEALASLLPKLTPHCPVPIFLVQHLPPGFTHYFASSLARRCGTRIIEAEEGMRVQAGIVYLAPGGKHLMLHRDDEGVLTVLGDAPPECGCRPSADVLFRSASMAYRGQVLTVVLTGMGVDGTKGAMVLKRAGAHIMVQDEATSVVWGMPRSVVAAGIADEVLPISKIGAALRSHLGMGD